MIPLRQIELANWQKVMLAYWLYPDSNMSRQFRQFPKNFPKLIRINGWVNWVKILKALNQKGWLEPVRTGRETFQKLTPQGDLIAEAIAQLNTAIHSKTGEHT